MQLAEQKVTDRLPVDIKNSLIELFSLLRSHYDHLDSRFIQGLEDVLQGAYDQIVKDTGGDRKDATGSSSFTFLIARLAIDCDVSFGDLMKVLELASMIITRRQLDSVEPGQMWKLDRVLKWQLTAESDMRSEVAKQYHLIIPSRRSSVTSQFSRCESIISGNGDPYCSSKASEYAVLTVCGFLSEEERREVDRMLAKSENNLWSWSEGLLRIVSSGPAACGTALRTKDLVDLTVGRKLPAGVATAPHDSAMPEAVERSRIAANRESYTTCAPAVARFDDIVIEHVISQDKRATDCLLGRLERIEDRPELLLTLARLYTCDLDRGRTAARLGISRRALLDRLGRIEELTGIYPTSSRGIQFFTTAIAVRSELDSDRRDEARFVSRRFDRIRPEVC